MNIDVRKSFEKDISKIKDKDIAIALSDILVKLENYRTLSEIPHLKKMAGKGNYYRIRVGDYRLGLTVSEQTLILIRFLSRKDIYKYFP